MNKKLTLITCSFLFGVGCLAFWQLTRSADDVPQANSKLQEVVTQAAQSRKFSGVSEEKIVATGVPRRGAAEPLVTIVQFSEFECASCQRMALALKGLVFKYPDEVAVVWKDLPAPARPRSLLAAKFARAVYEYRGNEAFWKIHDEMFRDLSKLGERDLIKLGESIGLDAGGLMSKSLESVQGSIKGSIHEAEALGLVATPSLVINGEKVQVTERELSPLVEKLRNEALQSEKTGQLRSGKAAKLSALP